MKLTTQQIIYLLLTLTLTAILIYTPHIANPYPTHIDEWRHITETIKIKQGITPKSSSSVELGFHYFLAFLSLITNLIHTYQFLPAIWTIITSLILFFITLNLTKNYTISLFTIIFFASLKSNVNIAGLWFFIPLTFSIPFIYLYIFFFNKGLIEKNKKYILISFLIILFLIPTHSISFLFSIPILFIFSLFHLKYIKKHYLFFSTFLLIPLLGVIFFAYLHNLTISQAFLKLLTELQFKKGWGVLELHNSPFELYSLVGYILAGVGLTSIISNKEKKQKYLIYAIWPITLIASILIFKITGISLLSPYQRNLYYFAISLPFLSSIGLYTILKYLKLNLKNKEKFKKAKTILIITIIILTFLFYFSIPKNIKLYKVIDEDNYKALEFLKTKPNPENQKIMAPASISCAIFPITNYEPVGTIFFYGDRKATDKFFKTSTNCTSKNQIIKKQNVSYILSKEPINCSWKLIYNKNNNTIYKIN